MLRRLINGLLYFLSGFVPRDPNKLLFGAWMGRRYSDNPKYFAGYLASTVPGLDLVWCGRQEVRAQIPDSVPIRFVRHGSLAAMREMLTAGHCFVTHGFRDVGPFNLLRGAVLVYVGHGLALKHMGSRDYPARTGVWARSRRALRSAEAFSYCIAVSAVHRKKLLEEFAVNNVTAERILATGQPRVDFLIESTRTAMADSFRGEFLARHALPRASTIVSYLPTFRDAKDQPFSFRQASPEVQAQLEALLRDVDGVLLEKSHVRDAQTPTHREAVTPSRIISLAGQHASIDTQELLLATDLLITDYSGCYLDYLVLNRPVIHFAYDYEYYTKEDRGLYFDLTEVAAGPIVTRESALVDTIATQLRDRSRERLRRERVRARMIEYESGSSSAAIAALLRFLPREANGSSESPAGILTGSRLLR